MSKEEFQKLLDGGKPWPIIKGRIIKMFGFSDAAGFFSTLEEMAAGIAIAVFKYSFLSYIFIKKLYPTVGYEKTIIFLMLAILVRIWSIKRGGSSFF